MRLLVLAAILLGSATLVPLASSERASACTLAPPLLPDTMEQADLIAIGNLTSTDEWVAVFQVETYYRNDGQTATEVTVENRTFNFTPSCDRSYTNDRKYEPGRYLALLERSPSSFAGEYDVTWNGFALYPIVGGEVQVLEESPDVDDPTYVTVGYTPEELEAEYGLQGAPPGPTATPPPTSTPQPPATAESDADDGSGVSPFVWAAGGLVIGAVGASAVWWSRSRR